MSSAYVMNSKANLIRTEGSHMLQGILISIY